MEINTALILAIAGLVLSIGFVLLGVLFAFLGGRAFVYIARLVVETTKDFDDSKADSAKVNKLINEMRGNYKTVTDEIKKITTENRETRKRLVEHGIITDGPVDEH